MEEAHFRIEVCYKTEDARGRALLAKLQRLGYSLEKVYLSDNYLVNGEMSGEEIRRAAEMLTQPVTQICCINQPYDPQDFDYAVEIGYLPGVTDNVSHTVRESLEDLLKRDFDPEKGVFSSTTYFLKGRLNQADAEKIALELHNPLIQRMKILTAEQYRKNGGMGRVIPVVRMEEHIEADVVDLNIPDADLERLGKEGIPDADGSRRGPLALDMVSLGVIKDYFAGKERRNPTDVELESIAQTWSEHCKHTIFAARLDDVEEGIYRRYIKEATLRIRREKGDRDFCVSVFEDNSGGIDFDENYIVSDKVETHNSPSALDPFGGSITGIVGVNRDAIGFGKGAKPIANRYGFCFADPFDERPLYRTRESQSRLLSPRRIMEGVIHGVNVGGNCSGIPTPQGFVYFDERYKGKPLVFVGTVGLIPKTVAGDGAVQKKAMPGDHVVMVGGRVGRDGIHGATFSSEALSSGSPATAVQIGDPITQKKLSDAIVKEARDRGLYSSITDNGAGGLSCSVAEMAREAGGFEVELDRVPLKYPGLAPWQIWVSESQERMTLAVPQNCLEEFLSLMQKRGVEATVIGRFTSSGRGIVNYKGKKVFDLDLTFLHEGLPRKELTSTLESKGSPAPSIEEPSDYNETIRDMAGRLNTASFEFISTQYDHEVQANSVIKPLHGPGRVNGSASVIRPLLESRKGVVLSQALYPSYSDIDAYWMAACSIDTAVRNALCVGGSLNELALLDNFCWCDSNNPERLGELKEAARACYDYAVAYGTPFISGKDSMFNDFKGYDENFQEIMISVPPTLLVSSIGVIEDVDSCQTLDFKLPGDRIYLLGETSRELGGSEYLAYRGEMATGKRYIGDDVPRVHAELFLRQYRALEKALRQGLLASCISVERGGLGVALARSAMAGLLGCRIDLSLLSIKGNLRRDEILFSESQGRVIFSAAPKYQKELESLFGGLPLVCIGEVTGDGRFVVAEGSRDFITLPVPSLLESYRGRFINF